MGSAAAEYSQQSTQLQRCRVQQRLRGYRTLEKELKNLLLLKTDLFGYIYIYIFEICMLFTKVLEKFIK